MPPFDARITGFLAALSASLLKSREVKAYADVTAFAFFCRRANLERMRAEYDSELDQRVGRGLCFHIAPGNVAVNFAFSLVSALLSGCVSVVKASSRDFAQTRLICAAMGELLNDQHADMKPYINVVRYPRDDQATTERLSAACDVRVIWGGDETVRRVRQAPLAPRATEITFPDRYSLLCADAAYVQEMDEKALAQAALGFYNDTYLTDQNACTAPRLVYWLGAGDVLAQARARWWQAVRACAAPRYALAPVVAMDKLTMACSAGMELKGAHIEPESDNLLTRVRVDTLSPDIDRFRAPGGFFVEYADQRLDALAPVVKRSYQTVSYLGVQPQMLKAFVIGHGLCGIDRIAPVGHTMDFSLVWDGVDLIRAMSRRVTAI